MTAMIMGERLMSEWLRLNRRASRVLIPEGATTQVRAARATAARTRATTTRRRSNEHYPLLSPST